MRNLYDGNISTSTDNESLRQSKGETKIISLDKEIYNKIRFEETEDNVEIENGEVEENEEDSQNEEDEFDFSVSSRRLQQREHKKPIKRNFTPKSRAYHFASKVADKEFQIVQLLNSEPVKEVILDLNPFEHLIKEFEEADIKLKLADRPKMFSTVRARVMEDSTNFLMDLRTTNQNTGYGQYIIIYPGVDTNIEVLDVNKDFKQLILMIQEPERELKVERRVFRHKLGKWVIVTNKIKNDPEIRHFLIGKDEGHLFVAQLNKNVLTVQQAHKSMMPSKLRKKPATYYKRQGEWFFVPVNSFHIDEYDKVISNGLTVGTGRAHFAESYVVHKGIEYVKGTITHPDHKTLLLKDWHRVYSNNENRKQLTRGLKWID
jgi:hypothetical protein